MKFKCGDIDFELSDEWIKESGFPGAIKDQRHYAFDYSAFQEAFVISISSILPPKRKEGVPIFNSKVIKGRRISARERTVSILRALAQGKLVEPVKVVDLRNQVAGYQFKLVGPKVA